MYKWYLLIFFIVLSLVPMKIDASTKERTFYEKTGDVIWEVDTEEKMVALTFDDGPNPAYTSRILDILNEYNAKGTFFVLGSMVQKHPGLVYRQFLEGHEVANHTFNHTINRKHLHQEIKDTSNIIEEITGQKPKLFRPVGGNYNQSVINISKNNGLQTILWSWDQDPKDWSGKNYPAIIRHVVHNLSPGDIILFHDSGGDRTKTIKALPYILEHLKENGYKSITVSEMIKLNTKHDFE